MYDEDDDTKFNNFQIKYSMKQVTDRLSNAELEFKCFYSCQRDEIYVKIRATPARLSAQAENMGYKLLLQRDRLKARLLQGKKGVWKPISVVDEKNISSYNPFDYIYGRYTKEADANDLYVKHSVMDNHKHPFRNVDRIKLIIAILEEPLIQRGCALNLRDLRGHKVVLAAFPLHEYDDLKALQRKWLKLWSFQQPVDDIRDYFGERIAFYFAYLNYYVNSLIPPAIGGFVTYVVKVIYGHPENFLMPYFTVFMILWSTFFIEFWKRKQITVAMQWGVHGFEDEETDRPEFQGILITSPINGKTITHFPEDEKNYRNRLVTFCVMLSISVVITIVVLIFILQNFLNEPEQESKLTILGINFATVCISLLNAVVIAILNLIYAQYIAVKFNNYENWRTDTEYEDNLVIKVFIFQLVNSYAATTYVSFVKSFIGIPCVNNSCVGDVAATLSTIFLSGLISRLINEFAVRLSKQRYTENKETEGIEPGRNLTPLEMQYILGEYDVLRGTLNDYASLTIQYGFTNLFVGAFPLAPTMACISAYIQIRVDGWKLCQALRRPQPKTAEDIGVWQSMLEIISVLSVVYNFGIILFTSHYLKNMFWSTRWVLFIVFEHIMLLLKYIVAESIPDIPLEVELQLSRQSLYVSKAIDNEHDLVQNLALLSTSNESVNIIIQDNDHFEWDLVSDNLVDEEEDNEAEENKASLDTVVSNKGGPREIEMTHRFDFSFPPLTLLTLIYSLTNSLTHRSSIVPFQGNNVI